MLARPAWQYVISAAAVAWVGIGIVQWLGAAPLGHDESQFAIIANDFLDGKESRWFYASWGMNALAVPGVLVGDSEVAIRATPFIVGVGFFVALGALVYRAFGPTTAAWTLAVVAGTRSVVQRSTELLSDLPAAACMLGALWIFVGELDREHGPRWRLVAIAPLFAAALYLRYGSCVPIAVVGAAGVLVWWRPLLRRPLPVVAAAALFVALLIPHFAMSDRITGSPLGILLESRVIPGDEVGLSTYLTSNPFSYYGLVVPIAMIAGVFSIARPRDRRAVFLWITAIGTVVGIGLVTHAQARYIMLGIVLLAALGVDTFVRIAVGLPATWRHVVVALAGILVALSWAVCVWQAALFSAGVRRRAAGTFEGAAAVRADARGETCAVFGRQTMQLEYYSGCAGLSWFPAEELARGERVYVVWTDLGTPQPDLANLPGTHSVLHATLHARVIRVTR